MLDRAQLEATSDCEGWFTLMTANDGGRSRPVTSGYCPNHALRGQGLTGGAHAYPDHEWVQPGETVPVFISFLSPEAYPGTLWPGRELRVQEGGRLIGTLWVTRVLNPTLAGAVAGR